MRQEMESGKISPTARHGHRRSAFALLSRLSQDPRLDAATIGICCIPVLACLSQTVPLRESESNCETTVCISVRYELHVRHELLFRDCFFLLLFQDCFCLYITAAIGKSLKNKYMILPSREAPRRADLIFEFIPDLAKQRSFSTSKPHLRIRAEQERNPLILPYTRLTRLAFSVIVLMYR
jgi:hypothetical protein